MQIYADCMDKGISIQEIDRMDACMYIRIKIWQLSQLHPPKAEKTIEDWIN